PQSAPQRSTLQAQRAAAAPPVVIERAPSVGGVQRYGEAVIRQVLGATFLREEPYEPPTRFS
ncbi:MAG: polymerase subunit gamma/tau, partial [Microbacterium sp.]|nr:polymerase subunit gamma/tau [Microbacterium sp.]